MDTLLEVAGLSKYYGSIAAVNNISFRVNQGEIFGFLGPNGAGKTTTIRLLLQLLKPDSGQITIFNQKIKWTDVHHRDRIGYLPGDFKAPMDMKARCYLNYMAAFRRRPPRLREQLIEQLKINAGDLNKKLKYVSHGTRQKVGLITAMEHEPELLILDEPTLGLDPLIQEAFFEIIMEFKNKNKTVFLSSHVLSEVERICDWVAIIRQGGIVTMGALPDIKRKQRRRLIVEFDEKIGNIPPQIEGAELIQYSKNRCHYLVEGDSKMIIKQLSGLPVKDMIFPEPELEDIFLDYFKEP